MGGWWMSKTRKSFVLFVGRGGGLCFFIGFCGGFVCSFGCVFFLFFVVVRGYVGCFGFFLVLFLFFLGGGGFVCFCVLVFVFFVFCLFFLREKQQQYKYKHLMRLSVFPRHPQLFVYVKFHHTHLGYA